MLARIVAFVAALLWYLPPGTLFAQEEPPATVSAMAAPSHAPCPSLRAATSKAM